MRRAERTRLRCVSLFLVVGFENLLMYLFVCSAGYSFFDSGEVALLGRKKNSPFADIGMFISYFFSSEIILNSHPFIAGKVIPLAEY